MVHKFKYITLHYILDPKIGIDKFKIFNSIFGQYFEISDVHKVVVWLVL